MRLKDGANIQGLDLRVRPALIHAERIWKLCGRPEGVTVTSGLDGVHSAGSLHYYGLAVDFRTRYFSKTEQSAAFKKLKVALAKESQNFDVIYHSTHIHVEYDPFK